MVLRLVAAEAPAGTYHATSSGQTSWWGFAREVVEAAGLDPEIVAPTTSAAFVRPAARPAWSVLGHDALVSLGIEPIGDWRDALAHGRRRGPRLTGAVGRAATRRSAEERPSRPLGLR